VIGQRLLLVAAGVAFALCVAEVGARLLYDRPWTDRLIEEQTGALDFDVPLNRYRLRGSDPDPALPPGVSRVLVLGDSFTFGAWVDGSETFVARLQAAFDDLAAVDAGPTVDFINGGIPGSLTNHWVALYERLRREVPSDVVVAVFFLRDGTRTDSIGQFFGPIRDEIVAVNRASWLYRFSYLWRVFQDARDRQRIGDEYTRAINRSYVGDAAETEEWRNARRNLRQLSEMAAADGAVFGLVIFPVLAGLDGDYPFQQAVDAVASFARAEGFPTHDLLDAFRGEDAASLWISPLDQHPNPRGHAIAAASLEPFVAKLLSDAGAWDAPRP